jgi:hypothetical protein
MICWKVGRFVQGVVRGTKLGIRPDRRFAAIGTSNV